MKKKNKTEKKTTLDRLTLGGAATFYDVPQGGEISQRLYDLGVRRGVRVECVLESPLGDPRAYRVRGTVIALRRTDAEKIGIES